MLAETFAPGRELRLNDAGWCRIVRFLGEGSQGSVYAVQTDDATEPCALKWYHPHTATASQRRAIMLLIERGAPDNRFLWPTRLTETAGVGGFGYLMRLRPDDHVSIGDLMTGKVASNYSLITTLGRELADSFLALHSEGLCYRDINFSNIFVHPHTGRPLITDTDNVGIDNASPTAVLGSRRFMAPEIVRGEAEPSTATDLYSLAVLLFYLLMVGHPLIGRRELAFPCWDEHAEKAMFGRSPLFVFDTQDSSNAPLAGMHDPLLENWPLYPDFVRELFVTSFTSGLHEPRSRVRESVWRAAMVRLGDAVAQCAFCGRQYLFATGATRRPCWSCGRMPEPPLRLAFDDATTVLTEEKTLFKHHLLLDYDFSAAVASVVRHPRRPDVWGLHNTGELTWRVTIPERAEQEVVPGGSVALVRGSEFNFGPRSAKLL